jgi:hypothetical protein
MLYLTLNARNPINGAHTRDAYPCAVVRIAGIFVLVMMTKKENAMAAPLTLYSNIPPELYRPAPAQAPSPQAPSLWDVYRQLKEPVQSTPVQAAVTGLRHNAEGGLVGFILGLIHGEFGTLDIKGKYPVDGIAAVLLYAASVRDAGRPDGLGSDFRALSQSCTTTLLYRKGREWREKAKTPTKDTPILGRSTSVDPIAEAGKRLLKEEEK